MATDPKYLREFACFRGLSENQLNAIAEISSAVCYPAGYELFKDGSPGDRLYFLLKGQVEVFYEIGEAGQVRVDVVTGEEIVGCSTLVDPYVYNATERCLTDIEVIEIDAEALRKMMREDYSLGFAIQEQLIKVLLDRIVNFRLES